MSNDGGNKSGGSGKGRDLDYQQSGGKTGSTFQTYRDGKAVGVDTELKNKIENQKEEKFKEYHKPPRKKGFINDKLNLFEQSKFAKYTGKVNRTYFSDKVLEGKNVKKNIGYTKAEFRNLSLDEQNKVFSGYMSNRMEGKTDAYGNTSANYTKEKDGTFRKVGGDDRTFTVEQIATQNETEETEEDKKTDEEKEEEYKKVKGLKGSRSMFGNAGGRGYFDPAR